MISVVIPTLNAQARLPDTLSALIPATVDGLVREVIVADGGSTDQTCLLADAAGAEIVSAGKTRSSQLIAGARRAKHPWLMFVQPGTVLEPGWEREASIFMEAVDAGRRAPAAAAFSFALDGRGLSALLREGRAHLRCLALRLPYGNQGLLLPRSLYDRAGGYRDLPVMEDLDMVRRIGSGNIAMMRSRAITTTPAHGDRAEAASRFKDQIRFLRYALNLPTGRGGQTSDLSEAPADR
jgi:glycosyltransferase involved in cell wall biosynthesis